MKRIMLSILCLLIVGVGSAMAGTWAITINESGIGSFNSLTVQMISGGPFAPPTFTNFSVGGWSSNDYPNATASGPAANRLTFNLNFGGGISAPLAFDFAALNNGIVVQYGRGTWDGSQLKIEYLPIADYRPPVNVPEPSFALLLGIGLGTLGLVAWRRKN